MTEVWARFWSWILVKILKLEFGQDFEAEFWRWFWSWILVKTLMLVKGSVWSGWILMILIALMSWFSNVLSIALRERLLTIASDSRILWISDGQLYNWVAHVLHAAGKHNMILEPWTRHINYLQHVLHQHPQLHIIRQPKEIRSPRHLCFGCKEVPDGLRVMELSKRFDGN